MRGVSNTCRKILFISTLVFLGFFANFAYGTDGIKNPTNLKREHLFKLSIKEIQKIFFDYNRNCGQQLLNLDVDPTNPLFGVLVLNTVGFLKPDYPGALLEFHESKDGTVLLGYAINEIWAKRQIDSRISVLNNPTKCIEY